MCAALTGEVPADTLEAYRRASLAVYDALERCQAHRTSAKEQWQNAWTLPAATQAEILCTWNAFVLQTLGDRLLDADYANDPDTKGFVLPITADQILRFYGQVEEWLNRAQQAHYNPDYKLDVAVPVELPAWSDVEPCPNAHLFGMMEALQAVRDHTEATLIFLNSSPPHNKEQEKSLNAIRQLHAAAQTKARYADEMMGSDPSRDVHERVKEHVKEAIEQYYLLGQFLAMPDLAAKSLAPPTSVDEAKIARRERKARLKARPLPGESGFDMWCLTDPHSLPRWKMDKQARQARQAIKQLWELDPDPRHTLQIQAEIDTALERGDIDYARDKWGQKLGHFYRAPWGPVYYAKRPVTIGGIRLRALEQFIFNVSCEGMHLGAGFTREIMVGNFQPTARFDYGDPNDFPEESKLSNQGDLPDHFVF